MVFFFFFQKIGTQSGTEPKTIIFQLLFIRYRVAVKITNRGHKDYTVKVILRVDTVDYTGKNGSMVTKLEQTKAVLHDRGKPLVCQLVEHE